MNRGRRNDLPQDQPPGLRRLGAATLAGLVLVGVAESRVAARVRGVDRVLRAGLACEQCRVDRAHNHPRGGVGRDRWHDRARYLRWATRVAGDRYRVIADDSVHGQGFGSLHPASAEKPPSVWIVADTGASSRKMDTFLAPSNDDRRDRGDHRGGRDGVAAVPGHRLLAGAHPDEGSFRHGREHGGGHNNIVLEQNRQC